MKISTTRVGLALCSLLFLYYPYQSQAQTDQDAIMMGRKNLCIGPMFMHSAWKDYWEGTYKRDNPNLGTVSTNMYSIMGNYGITEQLDVLFNVPYVTTNASAGTLHGQKGVQDLSVWVKWRPIVKKWGKMTYSGYVLGGASVPLSNYIADYLPLALGAHSKTLSGRLLVDAQYKSFFVTATGTYVLRSNIEIDRTAYYTNRLIQSNQVEMPDLAFYGLRAGYRTDKIVAEAVLTQMKTLGGFDIRRNDMPFPSNEMDMLSLGVNGKYELPWVNGLAVTGGAEYVLNGRNVGQSTGYNIGVFYIIDFSKKQHKPDQTPTTTDQK